MSGADDVNAAGSEQNVSLAASGNMKGSTTTEARMYNAVDCERMHIYGGSNGVFVEAVFDSQFAKMWRVPFALMDVMRIEAFLVSERSQSENNLRAALEAVFRATKVSYHQDEHRYVRAGVYLLKWLLDFATCCLTCRM